MELQNMGDELFIPDSPTAKLWARIAKDKKAAIDCLGKHGYPHKMWRSKGTQLIFQLHEPVVVMQYNQDAAQDARYEPYVVYAEEGFGFHMRSYLILPLADWLDQFEPVQKVEHWEVV